MSLQETYFLKTTLFLRRRSWTVKKSWQEIAPHYCIPLGVWARIYSSGFKQDTQCPVNFAKDFFTFLLTKIFSKCLTSTPPILRSSAAAHGKQKPSFSFTYLL